MLGLIAAIIPLALFILLILFNIAVCALFTVFGLGVVMMSEIMLYFILRMTGEIGSDISYHLKTKRIRTYK